MTISATLSNAIVGRTGTSGGRLFNPRPIRTNWPKEINDAEESFCFQDLKQRGLLEDTVILWTTEFGRMPSSQAGKGRDHNPYCFTNWLCGGGVKGGVTYGESDEWGYKPLDRARPTEVYDIHATLLYLLGLDHERLSFYHNGIQRRLTDVHGHVVRPLLA